MVSLGEGTEPVAGRIEFGESERAKIVSLLGIESLDHFTFDYALDPRRKGRFQLTGELEADLAQRCVVTLEPVVEAVREHVSLECRPEEQIEATAAADAVAQPEDLSEGPPAPIVGNKVDLGALATEILASAINPYPRKPDAAFDWQDPKSTGDAAPASPFAELAKLKTKS